MGVPGTRNVSLEFESRKLVFKNLGFKAILFGSGDGRCGRSATLNTLFIFLNLFKTFSRFQALKSQFWESSSLELII